jgi:hypothetical protein
MTGCSYSNCQMGTLHRRCPGATSQSPVNLPSAACLAWLLLYQAPPTPLYNLSTLVRSVYPDSPHPSRSLHQTPNLHNNVSPHNGRNALAAAGRVSLRYVLVLLALTVWTAIAQPLPPAELCSAHVYAQTC